MSNTIGALYLEHQRAIEAIDRLVESGCPIDAISLLMSDRTMQRAFSLRARLVSDLALPLSAPMRQLAAGLKPLAPLGAPGGGMVGTGPVIAPLERAGLGSAYGIRDAVLRCGAEPETAQVISKSMPNYAVLVFVQTRSSNGSADPRDVFGRASAVFELEGNDEPLAQGGIWRPKPTQTTGMVASAR